MAGIPQREMGHCGLCDQLPPTMLFPVLYVGAMFWKRVPPVKIQDMDFISGLDEIEADTYDEPPPRNKWEAFWQWLVRRLSRLCIPALVLTCYADVIVFFSLSLLGRFMGSCHWERIYDDVIICCRCNTVL